MAKTKKKRNKRYSGAATTQAPITKRYEAVERSRIGQWAYERKGRIRIFGILAAASGIITLLITGIAGLL